MSEKIYEDADSPSLNTRAVNKPESLCMSDTPHRQNIKYNKIQESPGGHNYGLYKLAVVCLGLLCVLLLAIIIGLAIKSEEARQSHLRYKNLTEEKEQLEIHHSSVIQVKDQLEMQYKNLTNEKKQLEIQNNNKTEGETQLLMQLAEMLGTQHMLTAEKFQLEAILRNVTGERDELLKRLGTVESMDQIKIHAVDVTLDPITAHPYLILSADGKQVYHGDKRQRVPADMKRFTFVVAVLAKKGFTSGSFYYEVEVKGKTKWTIGIARESINRVGDIKFRPNNGYWTIWLRNESSYAALIGSPLSLSLPNKPERVGVFVDYEAGLVSFYDADTWSQIYSFKNVSFGEKIYPFFSPSLNDGGKNSRPLIIVPAAPCNVQHIR